MSATILGKVACVPRGAYSATTAYNPLDIIGYNGSSYLVIKACTGVTPPNTAYYMLLAERGTDGEKGAKGDTGATGATGAKGEKGDPGTDLQIKGTYASVSALQSAITSPAQGDMYNVGTAAPYNIYMWDDGAGTWVDQGQLQGAKGDTGEKGTTFTPSVSSAGVITWSNDGGLTNPAAVNIKGPNEVSTATNTDINGLMMGNGSKVAAAVAGVDYEKKYTADAFINAAGWYRAGEIEAASGAFVITITGSYSESPSDAVVLLACATYDNASLTQIAEKTFYGVFGQITKARLVKKQGGVFYVDIYYAQNVNNKAIVSIQPLSGSVAVNAALSLVETEETAAAEIEFFRGGYAKASHTHAANDLMVPTLATGASLPEGANLDDYKTPSTHFATSSSVAQSLTNSPTVAAFKLEVFYANGSGYYTGQRITEYASGIVYYRYYSGDTSKWGAWQTTYSSANIAEVVDAVKAALSAVYVAAGEPTASDGADGDLWVVSE